VLPSDNQCARLKPTYQYPYTALFRSRTQVAVIYPERRQLHEAANAIQQRWQEELGQLKEVPTKRIEHYLLGLLRRLRQRGAFHRSEEHTSELQSCFELVCRLQLVTNK